MSPLVQQAVYLVDIINLPFDTKLYNEIALAAGGDAVPGPLQEVLRLVQVEIQRDGEGEGRLLGGVVISIRFNFGEVTFGDAGSGINIGRSPVFLFYELYELFGKRQLQLLQEEVQRLHPAGGRPARSTKRSKTTGKVSGLGVIRAVMPPDVQVKLSQQIAVFHDLF